MEDKSIVEVLNRSYNIKFTKVEKIKNVYKAYSTCGINYCLKVSGTNIKKLNFIIGAISHIQNRNHDIIPEIIKTKDENKYIKLNELYAYLSLWIDSRHSNFEDREELSRVSKKIAQLHNLSNGFKVSEDMEIRIGWFSWPSVFDTRKHEILDFQNRITQKACLDNFDKLYLDNVRTEIKTAQKSIEGLEKSQYQKIMRKEIMKMGFCHHDLANHNVLIDRKNNINIIDFDYCILDSHLHDLGSLLIRAMRNGKWNYEISQNIINSYCNEIPINREELEIIREFIRFPQEFWQIGLQKYWEQRNWSEKKYYNRLCDYLNDRGKRRNYLDNFI